MTLSKEYVNSKLDFINGYTSASNPATGSSLDPNSNITTKTIATLETELAKDLMVSINRATMCKELDKMDPTGALSKQYIEDLETHLIYTHDETSLKPYCVSISMYPFILNGMKGLGNPSGSDAPKHLRSFCGGFVNLVQYVASQFAGAVATPEFLMYFDYFARKDYGEEYMYTHEDVVNQELQGIVYLLNQDSSARGGQSVFWNISLFDSSFMNGLFGEFIFPDMSKPNFHTLSKLQMHWNQWFRHERSKKLLTFPVVTIAAVHDGNEWLDDKFKNSVAYEMSKGSDFFVYTSDSVDSLSSCCFDGDQEVVVKSSNSGVELISLRDLRNRKTDTLKNLTVMHDGSWVSAKPIKVLRGSKKMYKITTSNKKSVTVTEDHLFPVLGGLDKRADELSENDAIMFNTSALDTYAEVMSSLDYKDGYLIGLYLGDGSMYRSKSCNSVSTILSMNAEKVKSASTNMKYEWNIYENKNSVVTMQTSIKDVASLISEFVSGGYCNAKRLSPEVLKHSKEFRRGILDGYYETDGGNSNRIYSSSKGLIKDIEMLATSIGLNTVIDVDNRVGEVRQFRDEKEFTVNYEMNCIRWYESGNKRSSSDIFIKRNGQTFFCVTGVEEVEYDDDYVYCMEVKNREEPYFTLPCGMITHNCRLKNELQDNTFSYSLGAGGVATGSKNVITINFNRLSQKNLSTKNVVERIHKYHVAYNNHLKWMKNSGLLPVYDAGYISLDKQFLTIGLNGVVEAFEDAGYVIGNNDEYLERLNLLFGSIGHLNKEASKKYGVMFNTEIVPAEGLGVKNAKWDKEDGLSVNRDCYNSYFYLVEDESLDLADKMQMHGGKVVANLDGGSALHYNAEDRKDYYQYMKILGNLAKTGCNYFCENVKKTVCNNCGHIGTTTKAECESCSSTNVQYATRVIGYLKMISNFAEDRQVEASKRHYA